MDNGLMVLDNEGLIRITNSALGRLFRLGERSVIGRRPSEAMTDAEGFGLRLENLLLQGELRNVEIDRQDADGTSRSFSLASSMMHDRHGRRFAVVCVVRDITERKKEEKEREALIGQLQEALANVRQLSGMLPICSACKKIRDDQGYWQQIESYIRIHSEAEFTHSLCPDCYDKACADLEQFQRRNRSSS